MSKHEILDERSSGNGWFVYLAPGYQYDGAHCFGEDTRPAVYKTLKSVKPCDCAECADFIAKNKARSQ